MMMGKLKGFCLILFNILLCALFASGQMVNAIETFQNNLLKIDVYYNALGEVKVNLYTSKPYDDKIIVNKKNDFKYVILMPETSNSLTKKPKLTAVSDIVSNIDIKTQQYDSKIKGYTKITISTIKPAAIVSQVQILKMADYKISEKDFSDLIKQVTKSTTPNDTKPSIAVHQQIKKRTLLKNKPKVIVQEVKNTHIVHKRIVKKERKKVAKIKPLAVQKKVQPTEARLRVKTKKNKSILDKKVETKVATNTDVEGNVKLITPPISESTPIKKIGKFKHYENKVKSILKNHFGGKFYIIVVVVLIPIILLLLFLKLVGKTVNGLNQQKREFVKNLKEKPFQAVDYTENINEEMTWKEKFQIYVETSNSNAETTQVQQDSSELNELFDKNIEDSVNTVVEDIKDISESKEVITEDLQVEPTEELIVNEEDSLLVALGEENVDLELGEDISVDKLFEEDFIADEDVSQFETKEVVQEAEENFIQSEFVIDDEKGFYLVDYDDETALVGHIAEDIFVLKRFDTKVSGTLQARLNEHNGNSINYMTKVGNFKGIIEVTPENMNLLIEL